MVGCFEASKWKPMLFRTPFRGDAAVTPRGKMVGAKCVDRDQDDRRAGEKQRHPSLSRAAGENEQAHNAAGSEIPHGAGVIDE